MSARVLIATTNLSPADDTAQGAAGNAWRHVFTELGRLVSGVIVAPAYADAPATERFGGLEVRRVGAPRPDASLEALLKRGQIPQILSVTRAIRKGVEAATRDEDFSVVHALWAYPAGYACTKAHTTSAAPLIVTMPGSDLHRWAPQPVLGTPIRRVMREADAVVALGPRGAETAEWIGARRVEQIGIAYDEATFRLGERFPDELVVAYAGRMEAVKGIYVLARALRELNESIPRLRFVACGDGTERTKFEQIVGAVMGERATFLGAVPPNEVAAVLRSARVVVVPSFGEGMSTVAIEALASGRAVVTTDVGDHVPLVRGGGGRVVDPGEPSQLAHAIAGELLRARDPGHLRSLVSQITPRSVARAYAALYDDVGGLQQPNSQRGAA